MDYKKFLMDTSPKKGDFVFLDPPYLVQQVKSYYEEAFDYEKFEELHEICKTLDKRGVMWMLTINNNKKLKDLFSDYDITYISKHSSLSSGRGQEQEMIVKNY
jgi:DNA adenine methylase